MAGLCSIEGCGKAVKARGWCGMHYRRWFVHGDTSIVNGTPKRAAIDWLLAHANYDNDDCLSWPFCKADGYGRINWRGKNDLASRVMCTLAHGEPPSPKHDAAHSCGNGHEGCVNPKHLRWATRSQNCADTVIHGTDNRGHKNWNARLQEDDIVEIRSLRGIELQREIGDRYGICQEYVSDIQNGRAWAWLKFEGDENAG